jgi:asparagine synthase (glutamine-hydrolysing)
MLAAQAAYGPDGTTQWDADGISLGRARFRLLPEDVFDTGPMTLAGDGRLVADVRLDNRDELCDALGIGAVRAERLPDGALLAAAWSRWGEGCVDRLLGDYAFAAWHGSKQRLVLVRDPFGRRPLFVHRSADLIAFASMPIGLQALPETPWAPDMASLAELAAVRPERGPATFFSGIERIEPGHLLILEPRRCERRRHYAPTIRPLKLRGVDDYVEALREHLDRAVDVRLRGAGGEVGAQLSSGWDSSAVAATAARLLAPRNGTVTAFTAAPGPGFLGVAPPGRHADESPGAAEVVAHHANMAHVIVRGFGRSPLADLDRDIAFNGRPTLNPCNQSWFNDINRAARDRRIKVMLTGDFGNLSLTDDGVDTLPDLVRAGAWRVWLAMALAARRSGQLRWRGVLSSSFEGYLAPWLRRGLRRLAGRRTGDPADYCALAPSRLQDLAEQPPIALADRAARRFHALTYIDTAPFAKGALGAYGVDLRDPLMDRRLVEFCLSVPVDQLCSDGRTRALARRALADRLPASLLERRTRGYQAADWYVGLTSDRARIVEDIERLALSPLSAGFFDLERLRRLARDWPKSGWTDESVLDDYRCALLRGLAIGRFLTQTVRAND